MEKLTITSGIKVLIFTIISINGMEKPCKMKYPFLSNEEKKILKKVTAEYQYNENQENLSLQQAQEYRELTYRAEQDHIQYQNDAKEREIRIKEQVLQKIPRDFFEELGECCCTPSGRACPAPVGFCWALMSGSNCSAIINYLTNSIKCDGIPQQAYATCTNSNTIFAYGSLATCLCTTALGFCAVCYAKKCKAQREELYKKLMYEKSE